MSHASQRIIRMLTATAYLLTNMVSSVTLLFYNLKTENNWWLTDHQVTFTRTKKDTSNRTLKFIQKKYVRYFQHTESTVFPTARYKAITRTVEDKYYITLDLFATICLNAHTHFTIIKLWMIQYMYTFNKHSKPKESVKMQKNVQKLMENHWFFYNGTRASLYSDAL